MILVEIRPRGGESGAIVLNASLTVLRGLDAAARRTWAIDLARALRGETASAFDVEVDVDGTRELLTPDVARRLGLGGAASAVTVFPTDLPGARPVEVVEAPAEVVAEPVPDLGDAVRAARDEVERLRAELEATSGPEDTAADTGAVDQGLERLRAERAAVAARLAELPVVADPAPVADALAALRRLQQVKPKPSARALELADAWVAACDRLDAMPAPPQPPEWLVTPALAALQEAREALAAAEAGSADESVDPAKIEALDRAHRDVLEAEQRTMRKGSRMNRRRLDTAHELEQAALSALGVATYGEYLQRIAPARDGGASAKARIATARAALTDAEAVWEELHGGQASPEWTAAKEEQAAVRAEAIALLRRDLDDAQLVAALRAHLETVVDTGWAEQALQRSLEDAGVVPDGGASVEEAAGAWLEETPPQREARAAVEADLSRIDGELAAAEEQVAEQRAEHRAASAADLRVRLTAAEDRLRQAEEAAAAPSPPSPPPPPAAAPAPAAAGGSNGSVDLRGVVGMEAEAFLLARVAALRSAAGGPLPLVVEGDAVAGLSEGASRRVLRLLGRLAASGSMQMLVLGGDDEVVTWAEGLGDQATVRSVAVAAR